jgi:hypothetical protein
MPGANSRALCSKYLTHVVGAHDHLCAVTKDVSGRYWAVDTGMCAHHRLLDYIENESSNNPQMVQGACLVMDGVPVSVTPDSIALYEQLTRKAA